MFDYAKPEIGAVAKDDMCIDWDDAIDLSIPEFVILEEGDYAFTVTKFERGWFPGGAKIPACNKAVFTLQVKTDEGVAVTHLDLLLYKTLAWKLSSFLQCIGISQGAEKRSVDWNGLVGKTGTGHFKARNYTDREGNERQANEITKFYPAKKEKPNTQQVSVAAPTNLKQDDIPFM